MFPTEIQWKVLREELERQREQDARDQLARSQVEQPSLWSRLRDRINAAQPESHPTARPRKKMAVT